MKVKTSNLEWYVLRWDCNKKQVVNNNILIGLAENLHKKVTSKSVHNKSILKEYLKTYFMRHYWNKTECEMYVSDLGGNDYEKIDMWRQIEPNLDNIVEYVNFKCALNFK